MGRPRKREKLKRTNLTLSSETKDLGFALAFQLNKSLSELVSELIAKEHKKRMPAATLESELAKAKMLLKDVPLNPQGTRAPKPLAGLFIHSGWAVAVAVRHVVESWREGRSERFGNEMVGVLLFP